VYYRVVVTPQPVPARGGRDGVTDGADVAVDRRRRGDAGAVVVAVAASASPAVGRRQHALGAEPRPPQLMDEAVHGLRRQEHPCP
jgi:hypothetical protein